MPKRRPTLSDVAAKAGVSVSLASYALNGTGRVSPETEVRIQQYARELGYRANRHARSLRTGEALSIGVVIRNLRNPFFLDGLVAMEEAAREQGQALLVTNSQYEQAEQRNLLDHLLELGVGHIVVAPVGGQGPLEEWMDDNPAIPVVALNLDMGTDRTGAADRADGAERGGAGSEAAYGVETDGRAARRLSTVNPDHRAAVGLAVEHFALRGHREITFIAAPEHLVSDAVREHAFSKECERRGIAWRIVRSDLVAARVAARVEAELRGRGASARADRRDDAHHPSYLVNSDYLAAAVYDAAAAAGMRVGRDLSVIGHDDLPTSALLDPGLTTIAFNRERIGTEAIRVLRGDDVEHVVLPVALRERGSVADLHVRP